MLTCVMLHTGATVYVSFKVKFYVTDPAKLHEELTRYQFYLQIKKDLYTTRLPCSFESAALLASYMMQGQSVSMLLCSFCVGNGFSG